MQTDRAAAADLIRALAKAQQSQAGWNETEGGDPEIPTYDFRDLLHDVEVAAGRYGVYQELMKAADKMEENG
jgi:hypothetical protein